MVIPANTYVKNFHTHLSKHRLLLWCIHISKILLKRLAQTEVKNSGFDHKKTLIDLFQHTCSNKPVLESTNRGGDIGSLAFSTSWNGIRQYQTTQEPYRIADQTGAGVLRRRTVEIPVRVFSLILLKLKFMLQSLFTLVFAAVMWVQVPQWQNDWSKCSVDAPDVDCHWYVVAPDNTFGEGFDWANAPWFDAHGLLDVAELNNTMGRIHEQASVES